MEGSAAMSVPAANWRDSVNSIMELGRLLAHRKKVMSRNAFKEFVRAEYLLDESTGGKIAYISSHPVLSDPAYFDRLPTQWGKLYELSFLPDAALRKVIMDNHAKTITKYQIWKLRGKDRTGRRLKDSKTGREISTDNLRRGTRIRIPPGMTITDYVRTGIAMEDGDLSPTDIAKKKLKIGVASYLMLRQAVLLSDRTDLTPEDAKVVEATIEAINQSGGIRNFYGAIKPIVERVWGASRRNRMIRVGDKAERKRKESFNNALVVICDTCNNGMTIEIPHLSAEETASAINRVIEARASLQQLAKRLRRIRQ